jgi:2-dehydro-3-deoxyphosphooctonate aldolase (KDO 8-P synthase)
MPARQPRTARQASISPVTIAPGVVFGGPLPVLIMGPCVIEGEKHAIAMAKSLARIAKAVRLPAVFKASFDKANRSSGGGYRGLGLDEGLRILAACREASGLPITTDVHECWQVGPVAEVVDLLQVPALLCRQTDLVQECARSGKPTSIKKGQFLAPWDCGNIVAKFTASPAPRGAAAARLLLIERGSSFGYNRLVADLTGLPILRSFGVPVIFDGTHSVQAPGGLGDRSGGAGHLAPGLMRAALAMGVEGIFLETHDDPAQSLSDGPNMVPLAELPALLRDLRAIHRAIGRPAPPKPRANAAGGKR